MDFSDFQTLVMQVYVENRVAYFITLGPEFRAKPDTVSSPLVSNLWVKPDITSLLLSLYP